MGCPHGSCDVSVMSSRLDDDRPVHCEGVLIQSGAAIRVAAIRCIVDPGFPERAFQTDGALLKKCQRTGRSDLNMDHRLARW